MSDGIAAVTAAYQDGNTPPARRAQSAEYLNLEANSGGSIVETTSDSSTYVYSDTIGTEDRSYTTTIDAVSKDGHMAYEKTFDLPFSDPAVQMAISQARGTLVSQGAAVSAPIVTASDQLTNQATATSVVQTGNNSLAVSQTFGTNYIGPGVITGSSDGNGGFFQHHA